MRTTLKDLAKKTGFSVSTVSLALSGKESRLSKDTIHIIESAAREMNYRPNQMALGLLSNKTNIIGIVTSHIDHEFISRVVKGASETAENEKYRLMLCNTNGCPDKEDDAINMLLGYNVDGIILISANGEKSERLADILEMCNLENVPIVLIDRAPAIDDTYSVILNQEQGGYLATSHLLSLGHKRIGCITGEKSADSSWRRYEGYQRAMDEFGVDIDPKLVIEGRYLEDCGYDLAKPLIKNGATAIFAFNDLIAYGVYRYIKEINLSVPHDISLIGFDDIFFSSLIDTQLSTIRQPVDEVGQEAVNKLIRIINKENVEYKTTFDSELIVRQSTGEVLLPQ